MRRRSRVALVILAVLICRAVAFAQVSVSLTPTTVQVQPGGPVQFTATVSGGLDVVVWSLTGINCIGMACGQITSTGLYTAPTTAPSPDVVTVTATALADLTASASAAVIVGSSSDVNVTVSPATASLLVGQQQKFSALVAGTTITGVNWSLSGPSCPSGCGTITPDGVYTAPATVPNPIQVTIVATSVADPSKSGSAAVTVTPPISVSISPPSATVNAGQQQQFTATVSNTSNQSVNWSVTGSGCSGAACGVVSSTGLYTAPSTVPNPATVSVTATSIADPSKSATATVTITPATSAVTVTVSPSSIQLVTGAQHQFTATVANTSNTAVTWSLSGSCSGASCGTITSAGLYTAPGTVPSPPNVTVTATSVDDTTKSASATVTVIAGVAVSVSPPAVQVDVGHAQQFTASVTGAADTAVTWSIMGSGCRGSACGTITASGLYTAPFTIPSPATVSVTATSVADPSKSATAAVTITPAVTVTVSPPSVQVVTGAQQQFTATVSNNTAVTWSLSDCSGAACGTITSNGLYTAPGTVPNPALVVVTATSVADPTRSGKASVTVVSPSSVTISPTTASVRVGRRQTFLATVNGTNSNSVTWSVSGSGCTGSACGVVSPSGSYTAPATVPNPAQVTVKVTLATDTTQFASAIVTILPAVAVMISPTSIEVASGETQPFTATVANTSNTAVTWSLSGSCSGASCGTITSAGLYTAPGNVPSPPNVTVTATSVDDTTKSASATVTVIAGVAVSVSPPAVQVVTGHPQQFTALVTGSQNTGVTWSLSGSGCSGTACGSISSTGLYTAPSNVPNPAQVKVTAISNADLMRSGSATVTVIPPVSVNISPTHATVTVDGSQQFQATVIGSTNTALAWSVSGVGCSGSACGTISPTGLYRAPASLPSPATVIVKATSQIDVSESASATVNIVSNINSKLNGEFAFQFTGFDSNGLYQSAGTFTAHGDGKIAGLEDVSTTNGVRTSFPISGTYNLTGDNRGVLTLSTASGMQVFRFALNVAGTRGRFIEDDSSGIRGSGTFEQQDPSAFSAAALQGFYVLRLAGKDSAGARIGALGLLYFDGKHTVAGISMDVSDGGRSPLTFASFGGVYSVDSTGRGIANLSIPGFAGGAFRFAFYVVSTTKLRFISTDPLSSDNPLFSGPAELQSGATSGTSILSGPTVFSLAGEQAGTPQVLVGQTVFDGASQSAVTFDQNTGGTVTTGNVLTGGYTVGVAGTGALNLVDSNGHSRAWDIYVIGPNHAYVMDVSSADVGIGELSPQEVDLHFTSADILGPYVLGSGEPLVPTATLVSGVTTFDGSSALSGTEDISRSTSSAVGQPLAGRYSGFTSANNGRGTLTLTSGQSFALWVTSHSEVLGLELDSSNAQPVVLYFEE